MKNILKKKTHTHKYLQKLGFIGWVHMWDCRLEKTEIATSRENRVSYSCFELTSRPTLRTKKHRAGFPLTGTPDSQQNHNLQIWISILLTGYQLAAETPDMILAQGKQELASLPASQSKRQRKKNTLLKQDLKLKLKSSKEFAHHYKFGVIKQSVGIQT